MLRKHTLLACAAFALAAPAQAQSPVTFKGKTFEIYVGFAPGAGYDQRARLLSRVISRYLPGTPNTVVKNMEGAGSLRLANWLVSVAEKDGAQIGMLSRSAAFDPLFDPKSAKFDGSKLNWIGTPSEETSVCAVLATTGVATVEDLRSKPVIVGGEPLGDAGRYPPLLNRLLHTKLELVSGYKSSGDVSMAIERGEVSGRCGWAWSSLKSTHQQWVTDKRLNIVLQFGLDRHADMPNVPLAIDYADTAQEKEILQLVFARNTFGWPFAAPPGVAPETVKVLRDAFDASMQDPEFVAEAARAKIEVKPISGARLQELATGFYKTDKAVIDAAAKYLGTGG
jgi:tripartite-type tricarboxylate transporter receptor subunit TctC